MIKINKHLSRFSAAPPLILFLISIFIAIYHDIGRFYLLRSDADIVYVYQALLFNEGLEQEYFDHTGYIYFVLLSIWIKVVYFFNMIDVEKLSQLTGPAEFETSFEQLVFAGRWLSAILAGSFCVIFYYGISFLTSNRLVSFAFSMLFALSPGLVDQSLVMRTELPAVLFSCLAFFTLIKAIRQYRFRQVLYLSLACFFCMLALMSKMQIVFTLMVFPILALLFGRTSQAEDLLSNEIEFTHFQWAIMLILLAFCVPSAVMIGGAIARRIGMGSGGGWYQLALGVYLIVIVILYGVTYRYPPRQVSFALVGVLFGISLGQLTNLWHHSYWNTYALANFLEHMTQFGNEDVRYKIGEVGVVKGLPLINQFWSNFLVTLKRIYFSFQWTQFPFQPVYWMVTIGILIALGCTAFTLALQAGTLLGVSILMETITRFRYWVSFTYGIFTEPWLLIAGALLVGTFVKGKAFESLRPRVKQAIYIVLVLTLGSILSLSSPMASEEKSWYPPELACKLGKWGFMKRLPGYFDKYCDE